MAVVERLRPQAVLVENVPDLPRWHDGAVLMAFYESLQAHGYTVEARTLDGFRFGVPQHRQRLILIGLAEGRQPAWPLPTDDIVPLRDAIADLPIIPRAQRADELPYDSSRMTSTFQEEMRSGLVGDAADLVWDHISRDVRPDDMEAFALLGQGQTYIDLPERLRRYRSDVFTDKYKRLAWSELCRSITAHIAKDGYWYIHPDQHRTLSVREAARVQTFPDDFQFAGTQSHRFHQIGNAVPVKLALSVGQSVLQALSAPPREAPVTELFRRRLTAWHAERPMHRPWRNGADPWMVLACELSLRRAPASVVAVTYPRLVELAGSPRALTEQRKPAAALRAIGLKTSVDLLVDVARDLVKRFDGRVPEDDMELRSLKGVGDYVCQAVRCYGFGRRAVLLDRTTGRVSTRVRARDHARRFQLRLDLHGLAGKAGPDAEFNRALFDLGDTTCRLTDPQCTGCPVRELCAFGSSNGAAHPQLHLDDEASHGDVSISGMDRAAMFDPQESPSEVLT